MPSRVLWFRRDLRLTDHPALNEAAEAGGVVGLFVLDPRLRGPSGDARRAFLADCLRDLDERMGGALVVRTGTPEEVVPAVTAEVAAESVHISADFGVYGRRRDERVEQALGTTPLVRTGSPYAVSPGRLTTAAGSGYRVFTPYYRSWSTTPRRAPAPALDVPWVHGLDSEGIPDDRVDGVELPPAGESAAVARFEQFLAEAAGDYDAGRNRPGQPGTSRLSPYLKYGCVHPRTLLARLGRSTSQERFRTELAWRDFYGDVLWHNPQSLHEPLQPMMRAIDYDKGADADARFEAWAYGRTGYPIVDAGMRQLLAEAWMHNRVRMIVASFLVKDLHLDWRRGARWFMQHLVDGDPASNHGGWQWAAGTGTDPSPYVRVFNPTLQSSKFDPDGTYIRRYVPELRDVDAGFIHEPWTLPAGPPNGYPAPIVDHAEERAEALRRYGQVKG